VKRFLFLLLALSVVPLAVLGRPAAAQGGISVSAQDVSNEFPNGAVFHVSATSDAEITEVTLRYEVAPDGSRAYGVAECTGVTSVDCSFNLESDGDMLLIPGAEITYFWELTDAAGNDLETDPIVYVYEDNRFSWQSETEGNLTVWFYSADEEKVRNVLQVGLETLDRMGGLLGAQIDSPVKVFYYDSAQDMREAIGVQSDTPDRGVITLGEVVFSDTALVSDDVAPLDILRHELTHVVMRQAVEGALVEVPAWLEEGTAVYAQNNRLGGVDEALQQAIDRNEVFSVRALTSSSLGRLGTNVSLFYGQSWSLVSFLIDEFGPDDFGELFAVLREGTTVDEALQRVYGFDQERLAPVRRPAAAGGRGADAGASGSCRARDAGARGGGAPGSPGERR
jgi:hypothetical protein